ncbi:UNVERIFIED_CONTAM: hypothetical protein PYX00_001165 [Menopon gallinae]|uniref:Ubiquitin-like domain-containing protein n=1 Tax=Menopon gallinae TaxID=328185 RepID=A0AAW2IBQ7_9NEOP
MNMLEIPVKLIVKAPNQQFEDQTIHCNLSWTIKRLKGYLSEVYPSKPNTEDQRLIYYGQLLNDSVTLKDVFTRYEAGEETHTVHLVCMPSKENLKMQARKITEETGRKEREGNSAPSGSGVDRVNADGSGGTVEQESDPSRIGERNYFPTSSHYQYWVNNVYPQPPENYNYLQQLAWMQRIYTNYYMSQYMDMIARQNGGVYREGYVDPRQTEAAHNPEPQPRREEEDDDNRVNRDWLDYFYTLSRLLILFSIVCFYSSPARFLVVLVPGIILYLYQIGFFRLHHIHDLENNNEVANNNAAPAAAAAAARENNNGAQQGEGVVAESGAASNQEPPAEVPERPSFIALTWTFVTTFFSSMIPEMQNPV